MSAIAAAGGFAYMDAAQAVAAMAAGQFRSIDYVSALLDRIEMAAPRLPAFLSTARERALRAACHADRRRAAGHQLPPLHGVPFAVKDLIDVRGLPTTGHSRYPAPTARQSALAAAQLARAGAIYIGKLALEEFGIGSPVDALAWPLPTNPWDQTRSTGGSSSGSAAALAAGLVPLALGTDTGGSVRAPAAHCGLVALKPSAGRISDRGLRPLAPSLDTIGPMARTAVDCALMLTALTGFPSSRCVSVSKVTGIRLGVVDSAASGFEVDGSVEQALGAALASFERVGARLQRLPLPQLHSARACGARILRHEAYLQHRERLGSAPGSFGQICRDRLEQGAGVGLGDYAEALAERSRLCAELDRVLNLLDVLALPVTFGPAPRLADPEELARSGDVSFRLPFNLTGHPAVVFCTGFDSAGLPLSMQLVGRHGADEFLLDMVAAFQQETGWHRKHPPAWPG